MDENNEIFCKIVMSKSRVAPLKFVSVPQLELTAAKRGSKLMAEIWPKIDEEIFILTTELYWATTRTLKRSSKNLLQIGFIKSKAIVICHSGITFKQMVIQQIIVLEEWKWKAMI